MKTPDQIQPAEEKDPMQQAAEKNFEVAEKNRIELSRAYEKIRELEEENRRLKEKLGHQKKLI